MNETPSRSGAAWKSFLRRVTQPVWLLAYGGMFLALGLYFYLNHNIDPNTATPIWCPVDPYIPFNEWFALPYVYWFGFIPVSVAQMCWHYDDKRIYARRDFRRYISFVFGGWVICCLIFAIFPTTITFRPTPDQIGYDNFCAAGLSLTYSGFDEPVNVMPSLHCYSTVSICIAVLKSKFVSGSKYKWLYNAYYLTITTLICFATVLVKQHSILDVFGSFALIGLMYLLVYMVNWTSVRGRLRAASRRRAINSGLPAARNRSKTWREVLLPPC